MTQSQEEHCKLEHGDGARDDQDIDAGVMLGADEFDEEATKSGDSDIDQIAEGHLVVLK